MGVHVPESRHDGQAPGFEDLRTGGDRDLRPRAGGGDPVAFDDHDCVLDGLGPRAVDQGRAHDRKWTFPLRAEAVRETGQHRHAVLGGPRHKGWQDVLEALADRLEAVVFGINGDRGDEVVIGIEPEGLAAPDDAGDAKTIELDRLARDLDGVTAALFDGYRAAGKRLEGAWEMRSLPVADEHHLDRHGGEAASDEEAVGDGPIRGVLSFPHGRRPTLDPNLAVDLREARGRALDFGNARATGRRGAGAWLSGAPWCRDRCFRSRP